MTIHRGDLMAHLRGRVWLVENGYIPKAQAVLCDPPYGLAFMNQKWDAMNPIQYQAWCTEWGRLLLSFVYPGAVMLCFGGTRTYHRLAAGLEDAGWIVADCISWTYASGFPKSLALGKAIDRAAGTNALGGSWQDDPYITAAATAAARQWEGYGTALAPAYEPILVCRAPWAGTYAGIAQEHGTGALWIEGGRIGVDPGGVDDKRLGGNGTWNIQRKQSNHTVSLPPLTMSSSPSGRWPKNFLLGCDCESDDHRPDCAVAIIGAQSGEARSSGNINPSASKNSFFQTAKPSENTIPGENSYNDSGTAARFYFQAKVARWEREAGLHQRAAQTVNDGRDTPIDNPFQRGETERLNIHPTLKPIRLTEYLAKLILPPALSEPRRLLVPFSGSGSEMIGAQLAGWDNVTGFEQSDDYADIAQARIAWWAQFADYDMAKRAYDADHVEQQQREKEAAAGVQQLGLFGAVQDEGKS